MLKPRNPWASNANDEEECQKAKRRDVGEAPRHRGVREKGNLDGIEIGVLIF